MAQIIKRAKGKAAARGRRHFRLRKHLTGTAGRPRLVVSRSARHVFVQVVDDTEGKTLASASTMEADLRSFDGDKTAKAKRVGELVAAPRPLASRPSSSTAAVTSTTVASPPSLMAPAREALRCDDHQDH